MKTIYPLLLLSISTLSFSQNWNLVNQNKTVFFQHSDSTSITNTIVIDSTLMNGTNTNYYTGYAFKYCDTCQGFSNQTPIIYRYAKELLGFTIEEDVLNNQYKLDNNAVQQHSQLNDNWVFNTNLNATLVNTTEQLILGVLDSIKIIQLSNTDTIIISKNNGVVRYPDFENTGKHYEMVGYHEGQNSFGEYLPNFWSTYNFNVGNSYSYLSHTVDSEYYSETKRTIKILSKTIIGDSITLTVKNLAYTVINYSGYYPDTPPYSYKHYYNATESTYATNYINRVENCFGISKTYTTPQNLFYPTGTLTSEYPENVNYQFIGSRTINSSTFGKLKRGVYLSEYNDSLFSVTEGMLYGSDLDFGNNIGLTKVDILTFSPTSSDFLTGSIINGDTTGTVYNFPDDLGFEENTIVNTLEFYPNPANHDITFKTELAVLEIYSSTGQLVMTIKKPTPSINISHLKKGLYYLKGIDLESNSVNSKLIIN
jgi:hypothetical protein